MTENTEPGEQKDGSILVLQGVIEGIKNIEEGNTASKEEIEEVLKF